MYVCYKTIFHFISFFSYEIIWSSNLLLFTIYYRVSLRRSISKNTLEDDVLRTSTLRQSDIEKEVFSPVDKADDG